MALTAADSLLTKGIDLAVNLAGGDPAVARKLVEIAANALASAMDAIRKLKQEKNDVVES